VDSATGKRVDAGVAWPRPAWSPVAAALRWSWSSLAVSGVAAWVRAGAGGGLAGGLVPAAVCGGGSVLPSFFGVRPVRVVLGRVVLTSCGHSPLR
jgi:hypothetical protein